MFCHLFFKNEQSFVLYKFRVVKGVFQTILLAFFFTQVKNVFIQINSGKSSRNLAF